MSAINISDCNTDDTYLLGQRLADVVEPGDCITLCGDLGAGKTTFAKGLIATWAGIEDAEVNSPTYSLVHQYMHHNTTLWHYDLYRIDAQSDLEELGLAEALMQGITLIEWPDIAQDYLPKENLAITINITNEQMREICFLPSTRWKTRIEEVYSYAGK